MCCRARSDPAAHQKSTLGRRGADRRKIPGDGGVGVARANYHNALCKNAVASRFAAGIWPCRHSPAVPQCAAARHLTALRRAADYVMRRLMRVAQPFGSCTTYRHPHATSGLVQPLASPALASAAWPRPALSWSWSRFYCMRLDCSISATSFDDRIWCGTPNYSFTCAAINCVKYSTIPTAFFRLEKPPTVSSIW